jgi:hypothetical protein
MLYRIIENRKNTNRLDINSTHKKAIISKQNEINENLSLVFFVRVLSFCFIEIFSFFLSNILV